MTAWTSILRGAITRFIPGVLTFFGGSFLLAAAVKGITIGPVQVQGFTALGLCMTLGYCITLGLMRPSLAASAQIEGRRSLLAGLASTCVLLELGIMHGSPTPRVIMFGFATLAGTIITAAMFFPWMTAEKRRERTMDRQIEALGDQALRAAEVRDDEAEPIMQRVASHARNPSPH